MPEIEIPDIREIVPPAAPDPSMALYWWLGGIGLALLLLLGLVIFLILRRRQPVEQGPSYDARSSALAKLGALKERFSELPASEFALHASHGMREYLTGFYGAMTPFETGVEFLDRQQREGHLSEEKLAALKLFYERTEALKYAPAPGVDGLRLELIDDIIAFVRDDVPGRNSN